MMQFITLIYYIVTVYGLLFTSLLCGGICALLINIFQSTNHIKYEKKQTSQPNLTFNRDYYGSILNSLINPTIINYQTLYASNLIAC
jgi:hypothetical protein